MWLRTSNIHVAWLSRNNTKIIKFNSECATYFPISFISFNLLVSEHSQTLVHYCKLLQKHNQENLWPLIDFISNLILTWYVMLNPKPCFIICGPIVLGSTNFHIHFQGGLFSFFPEHNPNLEFMSQKFDKLLPSHSVF